MKRRHKIYILKAVMLSLCITLLLHFFTILLLAGYNAFQSPYAMPYNPREMDIGLLLYSFMSIFVFLTIEFTAVFRIQGNSRKYKAGWIILAVLATALVYGCVAMILYDKIYTGPESEISFRFYLGTLWSNGFLSFVVLLISYMDFMQKAQDRTHLENETLKSQSIQSRYQALRNQIDPHFLFNTFSSLTSIIEINPARAQEFSIKMSSVLRYTLQHKDVATLSEELSFVRDYCDLMQIRYGRNLAIEFETDKKFDNYFVAPLSIQTLIENVVKHNEISTRAPLAINIRTDADNTITVSNGINPKKDDLSSTGLGLANLSERYMLKWGEEIKITRNDNIFSVTIPLISPDK